MVSSRSRARKRRAVEEPTQNPTTYRVYTNPNCTDGKTPGFGFEIDLTKASRDAYWTNFDINHKEVAGYMLNEYNKTFRMYRRDMPFGAKNSTDARIFFSEPKNLFGRLGDVVYHFDNESDLPGFPASAAAQGNTAPKKPAPGGGSLQPSQGQSTPQPLSSKPPASTHLQVPARSSRSMELKARLCSVVIPWEETDILDDSVAKGVKDWTEVPDSWWRDKSSPPSPAAEGPILPIMSSRKDPPPKESPTVSASSSKAFAPKAASPKAALPNAAPTKEDHLKEARPKVAPSKVAPPKAGPPKVPMITTLSKSTTSRAIPLNAPSGFVPSKATEAASSKPMPSPGTYETVSNITSNKTAANTKGRNRPELWFPQDLHRLRPIHAPPPDKVIRTSDGEWWPLGFIPDQIFPELQQPKRPVDIAEFLIGNRKNQTFGRCYCGDLKLKSKDHCTLTAGTHRLMKAVGGDIEDDFENARHVAESFLDYEEGEPIRIGPLFWRVDTEEFLGEAKAFEEMARVAAEKENLELQNWRLRRSKRMQLVWSGVVGEGKGRGLNTVLLGTMDFQPREIPPDEEPNLNTERWGLHFDPARYCDWEENEDPLSYYYLEGTDEE